MLAYLYALLAGDVDAIRSALLYGAVAGGVIVAIGIIWEAGWKLNIPTSLVVVGVVLEAFCTIKLFVFDEGISGAQQTIIVAEQSQIITLEKRLAPRSLSDEQQLSFVTALKGFAGQSVNIFAYREIEPWVLEDQIKLLLGGPNGAGWIVHSMVGYETNRVFEGILVETSHDASVKSSQVAKALFEALSTADLMTAGPQERFDKLAGQGWGEGWDPVAEIWLTVGVKPSGRKAPIWHLPQSP
jgi:hypothetical protein